MGLLVIWFPWGTPQPHSGDTRLSPSVTTHKDTCLPAPGLRTICHLDRLRAISCYWSLPSGMGSTGFPPLTECFLILVPLSSFQPISSTH